MLGGAHQAIDSRRATFIKVLTRLGQYQLARGALQQARAELHLQMLNPSADCIGRHAQLPRGLRETAAARHLHKQRDIIEIRNHAFIPSIYG